ncbi:MAG: 50S ribosomal protein L6 [Nitrospirota bacterium]
MSRIGKKAIDIPAGVTANVEKNRVTVKGPLGELSWEFHPKMIVKTVDNKIAVERPMDQRYYRALHGLTRSIIANMVTGVSRGYEKSLDIEGIGFKAQIQGKKLILTLGYSHPVEFELPKNIDAAVDPKQTRITIKGIDKQLVGQVAADIRAIKKPEPYKGKGIRYTTETIKRKEGKAGKK